MNTKDIEFEINNLEVDEDNARQIIKDLSNLIDAVENKISEIGVEHQIYVNLGSYGYGRFLALEDSQDGDWDEYKAGEWISSSSTC